MAGAQRVREALSEASSRDEWLGVVGDCQSLINVLTAVQDDAIAETARRESVWCEDGTLGESVHAAGRVTLDAADVVAPLIGASHQQAQRRVEQAVRLAAGRGPTEADGRDVPVPSGLSGLHLAMASGQLDGYRAGVIAFELEMAPADVADAVVAALADRFGDDATVLRRRTRVLLERISPDLVRERAKRARAATGLRRWVAEPGVDEWHGTFPSEDAATAWGAIDRLAHDLVAEGTCTNIEQARGKALTDLVTGNATVDVQIVLTVPAATHPGIPPAEDSNEVPAAEPVCSRAESTATAGPARDGAVVGAHSTEADSQEVGTDPPSRQLAAGRNDGDDLIAVQGARPSEPLLVRRGWLLDHLRPSPRRPERRGARSRPRFVPCDPLTGARLDPGDGLATDGYRPGSRLTALVKARDGRCRFPGCSVAARFCDLDHVRPWPAGPTTATNLLTLCRRHHRIKQRPGWKVALDPDGTATWTDPTGRQRTTMPLDALAALVLTHAAPGGAAEQPASHHDADVSPGRPSATPPPGAVATAPVSTPPPHVEALASAWSALETHLQLGLEHRTDRDEGPWLATTHRRCTGAADLRAGLARRRAGAAVPDTPPF